MPWNKEYIGQALQGFGAGVAGKGPEFVQQLDDRRKAAMAQDAYAVQQALQRNDIPTAMSLIDNRVEHLGRLGGDPSDTLRVRQKIASGDIKGALGDVTTFVDGATRAGYLKPPADAYRALTPEERKQYQIPEGTPAQVNTTTGKIEVDALAGSYGNPAEMKTFNELTRIMNDESQPESVRNAAKVKLGLMARRVASSDVFSSQDPELVSLLTDLERRRNAGGESGKQTVQQGVKFFEQLPQLDKQIRNLDRTVAAIDAGADTGRIMSMLPSFREASIKLDQLRGELGLDIVGMTTFGALSKGELDLALATGLPDKMDEPALRKWALEKKAAVEKLRTELANAAGYLTTPGSSISGYLKMMEDGGKLSYEDQQGGSAAGGQTTPLTLPDGRAIDTTGMSEADIQELQQMLQAQGKR